MKRKAGRPKVEIDWDKVSGYLRAQCSSVGIAEILGISTDTLYLRCKKDNKIDYTVFSEQKKSEGKELLRAKQYSMAMNGNITMQIWLGKQYLGQRDKSEIKETGTKKVILEYPKDIEFKEPPKRGTTNNL